MTWVLIVHLSLFILGWGANGVHAPQDADFKSSPSVFSETNPSIIQLRQSPVERLARRELNLESWLFDDSQEQKIQTKDEAEVAQTPSDADASTDEKKDDATSADATKTDEEKKDATTDSTKSDGGSTDEKKDDAGATGGDDKKDESAAETKGDGAKDESSDKDGETKDEGADKKDTESKDEGADKKDTEEKGEDADKKDTEAKDEGADKEETEKKDEAGDKDTEKKDEAAEKKDEGAEKKDEGAEKKDEGAEKKDEAAEKKDEAAEKKDEGAEKKDEGAEKKDEGAEKKDEGAEKKDEGAEKKDEGAEKKDAEKKEESEKKEAEKSEKEAEEKKKAEEEQKKASEEKKKAEEEQKKSEEEQKKAAEADEKKKALEEEKKKLQQDKAKMEEEMKRLKSQVKEANSAREEAEDKQEELKKTANDAKERAKQLSKESKNPLSDELKKIVDAGKSKSEKVEHYSGQIKFPVLKVSKGFFADLTFVAKDVDDIQGISVDKIQMMSKEEKSMHREEMSDKNCPVRKWHCECGFKDMFWAYYEVTAKDHCFGVTGICADCDSSEKINAVGFYYSYDKEKRSADVVFTRRGEHEDFWAGRKPLYDYKCNEGFVVINIQNTYEGEGDEKGDEGLALKRDQYKLKVMCGKPALEGPETDKDGNKIVKWYNCYSQLHWSLEKQKWCSKTRTDPDYHKNKNAKIQKKIEAKEPKSKRPRALCEDLPWVGSADKKRTCAQKLKELNDMDVHECPRGMRENCPLTCGTCCGDNAFVFGQDGKNTGKSCREWHAEFSEKMGEQQECQPLLKAQCPAMCKLCQMSTAPPDETSLSTHSSVLPGSYSVRLVFACSVFLIMLVLFSVGAFKIIMGRKGSNVYLEFEENQSFI